MTQQRHTSSPINEIKSESMAKVGSPRLTLPPNHATLLCDPLLAGAGFSYLEATNGSGSAIIGAVLDAVVRTPAFQRRRIEDFQLMGPFVVEIPVSGPEVSDGWIRVEVTLSNVDGLMFAMVRHMVDTGQLELQPIFAYGTPVYSTITGWRARAELTIGTGKLTVRSSERGLRLEIKSNLAPVQRLP
jgi:hypothetical protein